MALYPKRRAGEEDRRGDCFCFAVDALSKPNFRGKGPTWPPYKYVLAEYEVHAKADQSIGTNLW